MSGTPYLVKRTDGTIETRYCKHGAPWRASESIVQWQALPWWKRAWYWVVSAW